MDRKAVLIGAVVTTALLLGTAYAGLDTPGLTAVVIITGFLTGAISANYQGEAADAALAVGIGSAVTVFLIIFGTGVLFPERIYPAYFEGVAA